MAKRCRKSSTLRRRFSAKGMFSITSPTTVRHDGLAPQVQGLAHAVGDHQGGQSILVHELPSEFDDLGDRLGVQGGVCSFKNSTLGVVMTVMSRVRA